MAERLAFEKRRVVASLMEMFRKWKGQRFPEWLADHDPLNRLTIYRIHDKFVLTASLMECLDGSNHPSLLQCASFSQSERLSVAEQKSINIIWI